MFCYFIRFVVNSSVFFNFLCSFLTCIFSSVFFQLFWFFRGGQVPPLAPPADAHVRNVYFGIVYSYLKYGVTTWGNAASKYTAKIQVQQNYLIRVLSKTPLLKKNFYRFTRT